MTVEVQPAVGVRGLTDEAAAARRAGGQGNAAKPASTRTYGQILRENVFTFVNNVLFILCIALVLVGRPLDAVTSILVIMTNVVVSVVQEVRAKRTLDRIALLTRPTATVRRGGVEREVVPEELVIGDLVVLQSGDQIVLDGSLVEGRVQVDESQLTGESDVILKTPGAEVFSGSFCVTGSGGYEVERVGADSLANRITAGARAFRRALTPLQTQVNLVIRVVLVIVIYLEIVVVLNSLARHVGIAVAVSRSTILATLVPNGLFVSIAIAYALGAVRIIRFGALVQQSNAVESLSNVDVLCLDKTGTLTMNQLRLEETAALDGDEERFRALLGVVSASATTRNKTSEAIADALPSDPQPITAEVPFSSARKWSAVAFDAGATRGTYVMGAPEMMRPGLAEGLRWEPIASWIEDHAEKGRRVLLLAHHPDPSAIPADAMVDVELPRGLRPVGLVALSDTLRPDAAATLARFAESGIEIKIISGDSPETVLALARQAGVGTDLHAVSGLELDTMDEEQLRRTASRMAIFGRVSPEQKERLVRALRAGGHYVAMIGDGVNDVLSLKRANLGIAIQSGSQAARGVADMILTNDSFAALLPAVREGRRILDGMQAILKLFLCRIVTLALVLTSALIVGLFPIELRQGSAVSLLTVGVPSVALAAWARPRHPSRSLAGDLVRFVAPVAIVSSIIGLLVFCLAFVVQLGQLPTPGVVDSAADLAAEHRAESSLIGFLVLTGLFLVVFARPPSRWWAVVESATGDWKPTILAAVLGVLFMVVWSTPLGDVFSLARLDWTQLGVTVAGVSVWLIVMWATWRLRLATRSIGLEEG